MDLSTTGWVCTAYRSTPAIAQHATQNAPHVGQGWSLPSVAIIIYSTADVNAFQLSLAVPTLSQCLEAMPHRDVRGVATRLGIRRRGEHRKAEWIAGILQAWQAPAERSQIIAGLSSAAQETALRLAQGGEFPAPLFLAEYGGVRRPQPGRHWLPPPWEAPQTISEELYYSGLLAAVPSAPFERAVRVTLPADLQAWFLDGMIGQPSALACECGDTSALLLHDVAQALCFLAGQPGLALLHGRWLAPAALAEFNRRLLRSETAIRRRSHAASRRARFIFFLTAAAGLCTDGDLTPRGWAWLAEPAAARLRLLWNAWRTAPLALRRAYRQATAVLPEPWPDLALGHLAGLPATFTAPQLAQAVLGQEIAFAAFFTAHLPDISALDSAAADLIETLAEDWGALAAAPASTAKPFTLTTIGWWLVNPDSGDLPDLSYLPDAAPTAWLDQQEDAEWRLIVSPWAPPLLIARLEAYARYIALTPLTSAFARLRTGSSDAEKGTGKPGLYHIYRLTEGTVAAAAAAGLGLPALLSVFTGLDIRLKPTQLATLQAWHARGHEIQLLALPLLRAARPDLLAQLLTHADVRAGLGELLSPTLTVTALPPDELAVCLRTAGFFPQGPGSSGQGSTGPGEHRPSGQLAQSAISNQLPATSFRSPAALWLAGQLYTALGEHTTLPLPPPFTDLAGLLAALPPLDQAVVQAQWEQLRADLQALLDGRTFAPPPTPSDPVRWRPLIESAAAAGGTLTMQYFTAGRNVLTQRTVTPYWIEEHRGIPYMRADCHLAGRVLLFRLDRIQEVKAIEDGDER